MRFPKPKKLLLISALFIAVSIFVLPNISFAQIMVPQIGNLGTADIQTVAGTIIQVVLGLLGLIALLIVLYGGFMWMTSGGNEEKVAKAKKILISGVIGLIIILTAYVITSFILETIQKGTGAIGEEEQVCIPGQCTGCHLVCNEEGTGSYYNGDMCEEWCHGQEDLNFFSTWHSPIGNNVSLCAMVQIGFNANVNSDTVTSDNFGFYECGYEECNYLNLGDYENLFSEGEINVQDNIIQFILNDDYKEDTYYLVNLPQFGIEDISSRSLSAGLHWSFKTGDEDDDTPPTIEILEDNSHNIFPEDNVQDVCLSSHIRATFSEDMDVLSLLDSEAFDLYNDTMGTLSNIDFTHNVNNSRTLTVSPDWNYEPNEDYFPLLNAGTIKDVCGNFLDGNFDGTGGDNYPSDEPSELWDFTTGENANCTPEIISINPDETYYDGDNNYLTITGNYLDAAVLIFNNGVYVTNESELCLDENHWAAKLCRVDTWTDSEITVFVPAQQGNSNGAESGDILVQTPHGQANTSFTLLSPRIDSLSPDNGGIGQFVTIFGSNFGEDQDNNKIYFRDENQDDIEAVLPCDEYGWNDDYIIIAVPKDLEINENYIIQVKKGEYWSNLVDFYVNNDEPGPGLCWVEPDSVKYEDSFVLDGIRFGDSSSYDREVLLGDDYNFISANVFEWREPDESGQDTEVTAVTPNLAAGDVGVRVMVEQNVDDKKFSNYLSLNIWVEQPSDFYITYISPISGPVGQYVTIYGSGFGNIQGSKTIKFSSDAMGINWIDGDFNFPQVCSTAYWSNDRIIVKVPSILRDFGTSDSKIKVIDENSGVETNAVDFYVSDQGLAPCICSVNPEFGTQGDVIEIGGEYFTDPDVTAVTFSYNAGNHNAFINNLEDNLIQVSVPDTETGLISASNINGYGNTWNFEYTPIGVPPGGVWDFYGWHFTTCAECRNPIVRRQFCDPGTGISLPSPEPGSTDVPEEDTLVYVEFEYSDGDNADMDTDTLVEGNFNFYKCEIGETPGICNPGTISNISITPISLSFQPDILQANRWYKVELTDNITDIEGSNLEPFEWYFHINEYGGQCMPDTLRVIPDNDSVEYEVSKSILYEGLLIDSQGCYICSSSGYNYDWESSDISLATVEGTNVSTNNITLNDQYKIGSLEIRTEATFDNIQLDDETNLYITANCGLLDGDQGQCISEDDSFDCCWDASDNTCVNIDSPVCNHPFVREKDCIPAGWGQNPVLSSPSPVPNSEDVVLDAHIYAEFTKSNVQVEMDTDSFDNGLIIEKCSGVFCNPVNLNISVVSSGDNFVEYTHNNNFSSNTWYKITLKDSIKDASGYSLIPDGGHIWMFKTGSDSCVTDSIEVLPTDWAMDIGDTKEYSTICYDESCNICDNIYTYNWSSSATTIAIIPFNIHDSSNIATGVGEGEAQITASNIELDLDDFGDLTVGAGGVSDDDCSVYNNPDDCNNSGQCCWDGSNCLQGANNPACDDEVLCSSYNEDVCEEPGGCCWYEGVEAENYVLGGIQTRSIISDKLNQDNYPDIVKANYDPNRHDITIGLNDGSGGFSPIDDYGVSGNGRPIDIISADVDNDNENDLIVVSFDSSVVDIFKNNNGVFSLLINYDFNNEGVNSLSSVCAGDINKDGNIDLIIGSSSKGVYVMLGDGNGNFDFDNIQGYDFWDDDDIDDIIVFDLNNDNYLDIVVVDKIDNELSILLNNNSGDFESPVSYNIPGIMSAVVTEVNGDGKPDLVVGIMSVEGKIRVFLNNGDGTFTQDLEVVLGGQNPFQIITARLSNDIYLDLVTANASGKNITVLLNNGDGTYSVQTYSLGNNVPTSLASADIDYDEDVDLIIGHINNVDVTILYNNGNGNFENIEPYCTSDFSYCNERCNQYGEDNCESYNCCWVEEQAQCYFINDLMCAPVLEVTYNNPTDDNICPNTLIKAEFNLPVDNQSLDGNVKLQDLSSQVDCITGEPIEGDVYLPFISRAYAQEPECFMNIDIDYFAYNRMDGTSVLEIYIQDLLEPLTLYQVNLSEDIRSIYGNSLGSSYNWSFITANSICELNYVMIIDPEDHFWEFNQPGEENGKTFIVEGRTLHGESIVPITGVYDWQWQWESFNESLVTLDDENDIDTFVIPANANGETIVKATVFQIQAIGDNCENVTECINGDGCCPDGCVGDIGGDMDCPPSAGYHGIALKDEADVKLFMCENPWILEDDEYGFKLEYCKDGGLDHFVTSTPANPSGDLLREYIFRASSTSRILNPTQEIVLEDIKSGDNVLSQVNISDLTDNVLSFKLIGKMFKKFISGFFKNEVFAAVPLPPPIPFDNDIIGLRIYRNDKHYSAMDWYYLSGVVQYPGNPQPTKVDEYNGLIDGRTVYVNAAYIGSYNNKIYTNIYLISHNQDVIPGTVNIFNQLTENWGFNFGISSNEKQAIVEDVKRWENLRTIERKLEDYAERNKYCAYVTDPVGDNCQTDYPDFYYHFDIDGDGNIDFEDEPNGEVSECYNVSFNVKCNTDAECENHEMGFQKCVKVYPELNEGTYLQGISTSAWPSWKANLSNEIGFSLPKDPVNEFNDCITSCGENYNETTCWDDINSEFCCPENSQIYYYEAGNNDNLDKRALSFDLYSLFNFDNFSEWSGYDGAVYHPYNTVAIDNSSVCYGPVTATCGNDIVEVGEDCEAGNPNYNTIIYCPSAAGNYNEMIMGCRYDCHWPLQPEPCLYCGDGVFSPQYGEQCDDGNPNDGDGCDASCQIELLCGNSQLDPGEECDDGNQIDGDGCSALCQFEVCGNSIIGYSDPDGDGFYTEEQCDDGNIIPGDGCDENCKIEGCGNGQPDFGEECDDGDDSDTYYDENSTDDDGTCVIDDLHSENSCKNNICGDGYLNSSSEQCDDGNNVSGDGCSANCNFEDCGDGIITTSDPNGYYAGAIVPEQCEPGDIGPQCSDADGYYGNYECNPAGDPNECQWGVCEATEFCGDGEVNGPEGCDDGMQCDNGTSCECPDGVDSCNSADCGGGNCTTRDHFMADGNFCLADCILGTFCGDGEVQAPNDFGNFEQCDDENSNNSDFCDNDCEWTCYEDVNGYPSGLVSTYQASFDIAHWDTIGLLTDVDGNINTAVNLPSCRVSGDLTMDIVVEQDMMVGGSTGIIFVSDISGSMSADDMANLINAIAGDNNAIDTIFDENPDAEICLVSFGAADDTEIDYVDGNIFTGSDQAEAIKVVVEGYTNNGGGTNHRVALETAGQAFNDQEALHGITYDNKIVILMTDGGFSCLCGDIPPCHGIDAAQDLKDPPSNVDIFSVGLTGNSGLIGYMNGISSSDCVCGADICQDQSGTCGDLTINCRNNNDGFEECDGGADCGGDCQWLDSAQKRNYHTTDGTGLEDMYISIAQSIPTGSAEVTFGGTQSDAVFDLFYDDTIPGFIGTFIIDTSGILTCAQGQDNEDLSLIVNISSGGEEDISVILSNAIYELCPWGSGECQNDVLEINEQCDDGNPIPGDGCDANCNVEYLCGNTVIDGIVGEQCDDGMHCENGSTCLDDSECAGIGDEVCKPRNNDGCNEYCQNEIVCGNGILESGEQCDDGNNTDTHYNENPTDDDGTCVIDDLHPGNSCKDNICGDGYLDLGSEQCDDGNTNPNDGCSPTCTFEACSMLNTEHYSYGGGGQGDPFDFYYTPYPNVCESFSSCICNDIIVCVWEDQGIDPDGYCGWQGTAGEFIGECSAGGCSGICCVENETTYCECSP